MESKKSLNKYIYESAAYVREIFAPLFKKLGICYFSYGRFYDDGSFQVLLSNPKWYDYFFQQNHKMAVPDPKDFIKKESAFYLWEEGLQPNVTKDARQYFDMNNGLTIIRRVPRYFEYFTFAFSAQEKIVLAFILTI